MRGHRGRVGRDRGAGVERCRGGRVPRAVRRAAGSVVAGGGRLPVRRAGVGAVRDRARRGAGAGGRRRGALPRRAAARGGGRASRRTQHVAGQASAGGGSRRAAGRARAGARRGRAGRRRGRRRPGEVAASPRGGCSRRRVPAAIGPPSAAAREIAAAAALAPDPPRDGDRRALAGRPTGCGPTASRSGTSPEGVGEGVEDARAVRPAREPGRSLQPQPPRPVRRERLDRAGGRGRRRRASRAPGGGVRRARVGLRPGAGVRPPAAHRSADGGHGCGPLDRPATGPPNCSGGARCGGTGAAVDGPSTDRPTLHARSTTPRRPARCTSTACGSTRSGSAFARSACISVRVTASVGTGSARSRWGRIAAARCGRSQSGASSTSHRAAHTFGRSDSGWGGR